MLVHEGDEDGDQDGVEVVDPPTHPTPPSPNGFSKPWAPSLPPPGRRGRSPGHPRC